MQQPTTPFAATSFAASASDAAGTHLEDGNAVPETSAYAIEPTAAGIVTATFSWWSGDLSRLIVIGLIPFVAVLVAGVASSVVFGAAFLAQISADGADFPWLPVALGSVVTLGVASVAYAAAGAGSVLAVEEWARGQPGFDAWGAFVTGLGSLKRLFAVLLLLGVVGLGAISGVTLLSLGLEIFNDTIGSATVALLREVLALGGVVLGVWVAARLSPLVAVFMVEEPTVLGGLRRTWALTRGSAATIVAAATVVGAATVVLTTAIGIFALIPFLGFFMSLATMAIIPPLAHTFTFATYAACLQRAR